MPGKFLATAPAIDVRYVDSQLDHPELTLLTTQLERLGFTRLGTLEERLAGHEPAVSANFACAERRAFASIFISVRGQPKLFFFTPFEGGGCVLTGRYPRPEVRTDNVTFTGAGRMIAGVLTDAMAEGKDLEKELAAYGLTWPVPESFFDVVIDPPTLEELLEQHAREVAAKGKPPYREWSKEARLRSIHEFYELDEAWGPLIKPVATS